MSNFNSGSFTIEGGMDGDIALDILNNDTKELTLKDAIIDLYLNVKIRNSEDVSIKCSCCIISVLKPQWLYVYSNVCKRTPILKYILV
jgi:hypothetical protein